MRLEWIINLCVYVCVSVDAKKGARFRFRLKKSGNVEVESVTDSVTEVFRDVTSGVHNAQNPWAFYCQMRHVAAMQQRDLNQGRHRQSFQFYALTATVIFSFRLHVARESGLSLPVSLRDRSENGHAAAWRRRAPTKEAAANGQVLIHLFHSHFKLTLSGHSIP